MATANPGVAFVQGKYPSSPLRAQNPVYNNFTHTTMVNNDHRKNVGDDIGNSFVNPFPDVADFFKRFMPLGDKRVVPTFRNLTFPGLANNSPENQLYEPFAKAVNGWNKKQDVFRGFKLIDTSHSRDGETKLQPDLMLVANSDKVPPRPAKTNADRTKRETWEWETTEIHVEVKTASDLFHTTLDKLRSVVNVRNEENIEKVGQIGTYAAAQMSRQHRVHLFSLFIYGDFMRIIRWDRSGAVTTDPINYRNRPRVLAEFLYRYTHMTRAQRGWDTTVERGTSEDAEILSAAIKAYQSDKSLRQLPRMEVTLKDCYPVYRMKVDVKIPAKAGDGAHPGDVGDAGEGEEGGEEDEGPITRTKMFLVRKPFWHTTMPTGRGTRVYVAWDLEDKRLVSVKDSWRVEFGSSDPEGDIYEEFDAVDDDWKEFLPTVIGAGDVPDEESPDGKQRTATQTLEQESRKRHSVAHLRTHVHHRVVQELAFPLISFTHSRELVQGIRDAMFAVIGVYKRFHRLHRDVSAGNVMLSKDGRGLMNDWDHSRPLLEQLMEMLQTYRTGTWQFLSIGLLQDPNKPHTIMDDMESFFWVLGYMGVHYLPNTYASNAAIMFDEVTQMDDIVVGGSHKELFLNKHRYRGKFECAPLDRLVNGLRGFFQDYSVRTLNGDDSPDHIAHHSRLLQDPSELLVYFDDALASTDWPDVPDRLQKDKFPAISITKAATQVRIATEKTYSSNKLPGGRAVPAQPDAGSSPSAAGPAPSAAGPAPSAAGPVPPKPAPAQPEVGPSQPHNTRSSAKRPSDEEPVAQSTRKKSKTIASPPRPIRRNPSRTGSSTKGKPR